ncbi:hypothetical protein BOW53_03620 [Solemya pervernicosa gill symbiont]|uniref:Uncharacterized protein n=2 Tax=Gammaproteobacteria incertae sedis TaxID=118884 RepID=A0A1T2L8N9_9GAMM|nr:ECF transporter S component [Candidatus Reidiella endopervernicosa]OOZ41473.1 hypothetical protein BOW53_03620 [Solemya pervernicosa gill symbiont]QKQ27332.1 ECF transporter S component [Candidatus Reidiella endopervernicosa]
MFFGVNQIFGSIFVLLAVWYLGPAAGALCAIIVHSYTIYLWGHPYAFIGFVLEALMVGVLLRWRIRNIFIADIIYWLLIGVWLVPLFYGHYIGLPETQVTLIMLKQPANGLLNALTASLIIFLAQRWLKTSNKVSLRYALFTFIMVTVAFSLYAAANLITRYTFENSQKDVTENLHTFGSHIDNELRHFLRDLPASMRQLDRTAASGDLPVNLDKQYIIDTLWRLERSNESQVIASKHETAAPLTTPFPCNNSTSITLQENQLYVSFLTGDRCLIGSLPASRLEQFLNLQAVEEGVVVFAVIDNHVVTSSLGNQVDAPFEGTSIPLSKNIYHLLPSGEMPKMRRYKLSHYIYELPKNDIINWQTIIKLSFSKHVDELQRIYIFIFSVMLGVILLVALIAYLLSNSLLYALTRLTTITADLPKKIEQRETISWPQSNIQG